MISKMLFLIAVVTFGSCLIMEREGDEHIVVYDVTESPTIFHHKYIFNFWDFEFWNNLVDEDENAVGGVDTMMHPCFEDEEDYLRPNTWGRGSDLGYEPITEEPDGRLTMRRGTVREVTHDLWENRGLQAFEWGGDVTLIGREGALSQIPEYHSDAFYFNLSIFGEFEMQYIMYHEREGSALWHLLMHDNPYASDTSMPFVTCWKKAALGYCECGVPRSQ